MPNRLPPLSLSEDLPPVLAVSLHFSTSMTQVDVMVHKVKFVSIIDTVSPINTILALLAQKNKDAA